MVRRVKSVTGTTRTYPLASTRSALHQESCPNANLVLHRVVLQQGEEILFDAEGVHPACVIHYHPGQATVFCFLL